MSGAGREFALAPCLPAPSEAEGSIGTALSVRLLGLIHIYVLGVNYIALPCLCSVSGRALRTSLPGPACSARARCARGGLSLVHRLGELVRSARQLFRGCIQPVRTAVRKRPLGGFDGIFRRFHIRICQLVAIFTNQLL